MIIRTYQRRSYTYLWHKSQRLSNFFRPHGSARLALSTQSCNTGSCRRFHGDRRGATQKESARATCFYSHSIYHCEFCDQPPRHHSEPVHSGLKAVVMESAATTRIGRTRNWDEQAKESTGPQALSPGAVLSNDDPSI